MKLKGVLYALIPLIVLLSFSVLACVLGYFLIQIVGDRFALSRVLSKTTLFFLMLSIFPSMAWLKINASDLGFASGKKFIKQIPLGFALGLLTLLPVLIAEYGLGIHSFDQTKHWTTMLLAQKMGETLLIGLLIAMIEEPLFRGLLITALGKRLPLYAAVLISAVYYASMHFLRSHSKIPSDQVTFSSGFTLLSEAFANVLNPVNLSAWLALLTVGIFLGILRTRSTANLGMCIGCHAAWVWQIKMSKSLFDTRFKSDYGFLVSHYDGVIGWLVAGWMSLFLLAYWAYRRFRSL